MNKTELINIAEEWDRLTNLALDLEKIPAREMGELLKRSYLALSSYHNEELVPKEISRLFLAMDNFIYFVFLIGEREMNGAYYNYRKMYAFSEALKKGFFSGEYEPAFPKIKLSYDKSEVVFDFEKDRYEILLL